MTELRKTPLRRSLYRSNTILGAERVPVMLILLASTTLIFTGLTLLTTVIGISIGLLGVFGLRFGTSWHPQIVGVVLGDMKYRNHYPARPRFESPMPHLEVIERSHRERRHTTFSAIYDYFFTNDVDANE